MPRYVALLRGIGPTNPNMRNEKLCAVFKGLGFTDIEPVLASGNIVFASSVRSTAALETKIERALAAKLGLSLDVMVRGQPELEKMIKRDPFEGKEHGKKHYLVVTFRKDSPRPIFTALDRAKMDGPEFMADLGREHGKRITTRTWNTIHKIVAKMQK